MKYGGAMDRRPATPEEARALANPLRLRIIRLCLNQAMTNEQLATRLGRNAGSMLHHVRMLVDTGFLAPEEERRGARGSSSGRTGRPASRGRSTSATRRGLGKTNLRTLALIEAFRAEVAECRGRDRRALAARGPACGRTRATRSQERIEALVAGPHGADDPDGEPYGFLSGCTGRAD